MNGRKLYAFQLVPKPNLEFRPLILEGHYWLRTGP